MSAPLSIDRLLTVSSHSGNRMRELSGVPFMRALIPFMEVHLHDLITFQSPYLGG